MGPEEIDGLLVPPGKAYMLLSGPAQEKWFLVKPSQEKWFLIKPSIHIYWLSWVVIFESLFECHGVLNFG